MSRPKHPPVFSFVCLLILLIVLVVFLYKQHSPAQFTRRIPIIPDAPLWLEGGLPPEENTTARIIDLLTPIGRGQRTLISAPAGTGKTLLLSQIGRALHHNYPDMHLIVIMAGAQQHDIEQLRHTLDADIYASSDEMTTGQQIRSAEMALLQAHARVVQHQPVIVLIDSLTSLALSYQQDRLSWQITNSETLPPAALRQVRRFLSIPESAQGLLTIIGTLSGTSNNQLDAQIDAAVSQDSDMPVYLETNLALQQVSPAINPLLSGTRQETTWLPVRLLPAPADIRRQVMGMDTAEAMQFIIDKIKSTPDNHILREQVRHDCEEASD